MHELIDRLWDFSFPPLSSAPRESLSLFSHIPAEGKVTSPFGIRMHPIFNKLHFHTGIDIANNIFTPIQAVQSGLIKFAGIRGGYGKCIIIDHGLGWSTTYAHLSKILVKRGTYVGAGVVIGLMGESGLTTGPHLHFELSYKGKHLNPLPYLAEVRVKKEAEQAFITYISSASASKEKIWPR